MSNSGDSKTQSGWWLLLFVCVLYGAFALYMSGLQGLYLLGAIEEAPFRAAPFGFVLHAFAGGIALIAAPVQMNGRLRRRRKTHKIIGRVYVGAIGISSVTALWLVTSFDVNLAARISFGILSSLWLATTLISLLRILNKDIVGHREWMTRSVALTLFFITFSIWVPALEVTAIPDQIGYPLSVSLSWGLNLLVAELWIRRSRVRGKSHRLDRPEPGIPMVRGSGFIRAVASADTH